MQSTVKLIQSKDALGVINSYPEHMVQRLLELRSIILETAQGIEDIDTLEETLKWGEPSYISKNGSTIRIDWKAKTPERFSIYFKCTTKLVATFKKTYGDTFKYENNRAIYFKLDEEIPKDALSHCITLALTYHEIKDTL